MRDARWTKVAAFLSLVGVAGFGGYQTLRSGANPDVAYLPPSVPHAAPVPPTDLSRKWGETYGLKPGETLRRVVASEAQRRAFYRDAYPVLACGVRQVPAALIASQQDQEDGTSGLSPSEDMSFSRPFRVRDVLTRVVGVPSWRIRGEPELLDQTCAGDWVVRSDLFEHESPMPPTLRPALSDLNHALNDDDDDDRGPIRFSVREEPADVIVLKGKPRAGLTTLTVEAADEDIPDAPIRGPLSKLAGALERAFHAPLIIDAEAGLDPIVELRFEPPAQSDRGCAVANVAEQAGLTPVYVQREIKMVRVERAIETPRSQNRQAMSTSD